MGHEKLLLFYIQLRLNTICEGLQSSYSLCFVSVESSGSIIVSINSKESDQTAEEHASLSPG